MNYRNVQAITQRKVTSQYLVESHNLLLIARIILWNRWFTESVSKLLSRIFQVINIRQIFQLGTRKA